MAYAPAGNTTSSVGLAHAKQTFYNNVGLDRLQKKFIFREAAVPDMIPKRNGRVAQWFRYDNLASNTTPSTEGAVGTSLTPSSNIVGAKVSQFSDFISFSTMLMDTLIDPVAQSFTELLSYRAGLTVDTLTRDVIDAVQASTNQALLGAYATLSDLRAGRHNLQANDVKGIMDDNTFLAIVHPYVTFDIINDPGVNGVADILKYNTNVASGPLGQYEDRGFVTKLAGCKIVESTNCKVTAGSPNLYRMYLFGKGGLGTLSIDGREPTNVKNPDSQRFRIRVVQGGPENVSLADPEGQIGGAVSYYFTYVAVILDGPAGIGGTYRMKTFECPSSLA